MGNSSEVIGQWLPEHDLLWALCSGYLARMPSHVKLWELVTRCDLKRIFETMLYIQYHIIHIIPHYYVGIYWDYVTSLRFIENDWYNILYVATNPTGLKDLKQTSQLTGQIQCRSIALRVVKGLNSWFNRDQAISSIQWLQNLRTSRAQALTADLLMKWRVVCIPSFEWISCFVHCVYIFRTCGLYLYNKL